MALKEAEKSREEIKQEKKQEKRSVKAFNSMQYDGPFGKIQFILYAISVPLGFFVALPVGIVVQQFDHICPLYADITWHATHLWSRSEGACAYVIFGNVAISIVYALFMTIVTYFIIDKRTKKQIRYTRLIHHVHERFLIRGMNPVFTFVNTIALLVLLGSAIVLSVGLGRFCEQLSKAKRENPDFKMDSCASGIDWDRLKMFGGGDSVNGSGFYPGILIACLASWLLVINWFLLFMLNCAICCGKCSLEVSEEKLKPTAETREAYRLTMSQQTSGRTTPRMASRSVSSIPQAQGSQMSVAQSYQGRMFPASGRGDVAERPTKFVRRQPHGSIDQEDEDYPIQQYERQPQQFRPVMQNPQNPQQYYQPAPQQRQPYARPPQQMVQHPPHERQQYAPPSHQLPQHAPPAHQLPQQQQGKPVYSRSNPQVI